jgi:WD40 repeat protein
VGTVYRIDGFKLRDTASGQLLRTFQAQVGEVQTVQFSPDGTVLALTDQNGAVKLWDPASGHVLLTFRKPHFANRGSSLAFSPDGARLTSAIYDGTVKLWNAANGQELLSIKGNQGVRFSPDGARLATMKAKSRLYNAARRLQQAGVWHHRAQLGCPL